MKNKYNIDDKIYYCFGNEILQGKIYKIVKDEYDMIWYAVYSETGCKDTVDEKHCYLDEDAALKYLKM